MAAAHRVKGWTAAMGRARCAGPSITLQDRTERVAYRGPIDHFYVVTVFHAVHRSFASDFFGFLGLQSPVISVRRIQSARIGPG